MRKKKRKGQSHSVRPPTLAPPQWLKQEMTPEDVELLTVELAKKGYTPSMIGVILRDQFGVPLVKSVTGKKLTNIFEEKGVKPVVPEDLFFLLKKAVNLHRHLSEHPKDYHAKRGLIVVESKIHRLVKYYKRTGKLPRDWTYTVERAKLIVSGSFYK